METKMLLGKELSERLQVMPGYDQGIHGLDAAERLCRLNDLYDIYIPSSMSEEIYCKLYMTLMKSLKQKNTVTAVQQSYENNRCLRRQQYKGLMGGADAFTIIGCSGIGKSISISRAISVIEEQVRCEDVLPFVVVQCPFDSSVKGLLLEILRVVDGPLGTDYYESAKRKNATTDVLIGMISQIALTSIGILIVDEIQNVVNSRNGRVLVGMLTQLINNSGIGICMVGTPECTEFFEQAMQLARRSLGLSYSAWEYSDTFRDFCSSLLAYQYVSIPGDCTEEVLYWLYEHSGGVASVVVSLLHDAQEIAILTGYEILDISVLEEAYKKRLYLLHDYVRPEPVRPSSERKKRKSADPVKEQVSRAGKSLIELKDAEDFMPALMAMTIVEEIAL